MSWGYVPKKLKQARRQRRIRKKYKNFSCETCHYGTMECWHRKYDVSVTFCKKWKAGYKAKYAQKTSPAPKNEKKTTFKERIKSIFK